VGGLAERALSDPPRILDFGLATLSLGADGPVRGVTHTRLTEQGAVLGTLHYMAPEQLAGKPADARTDLFAFGAIVYEMVTGRRAFDRPNDVMPGAPPAVQRLTAICLSKQPDARWSTAHDVLIQLKDLSEAVRHDAGSPSASATQPSARRLGLAWGAIGAACGAAVAVAALLLAGRLSGEPKTASLDVVSLLPPGDTTLTHGEAPQVSPDGRQVAFLATDRSGRTGIYVRNRDALGARLLPDTVSAVPGAGRRRRIQARADARRGAGFPPVPDVASRWPALPVPDCEAGPGQLRHQRRVGRLRRLERTGSDDGERALRRAGLSDLPA